MTDRKPYEPNWPHGYETRDGRKAEYIGELDADRLLWRSSGTLVLTSADGLDHNVTTQPHSPLDIFCTPAPVVGRVERYLAQYGVNEIVRRSAGDFRWNTGLPLLGPVHLREVRPGDMTAEDVEAFAAKLEVLASGVVTEQIGHDLIYLSIARMLRATSREDQAANQQEAKPMAQADHIRFHIAPGVQAEIAVTGGTLGVRETANLIYLLRAHRAVMAGKIAARPLHLAPPAAPLPPPAPTLPDAKPETSADAPKFPDRPTKHGVPRETISIGEQAGSLRGEAHGGGHAAVAVAIRGREDGAQIEIGDDKAFALRASQGGSDKPHVLTHAVRRLTPTECERLQGFPDGHTDVPNGNKTAADGPRYKALGNSMAVPVIRWIGLRIERQIEGVLA